MIPDLSTNGSATTQMPVALDLIIIDSRLRDHIDGCSVQIDVLSAASRVLPKQQRTLCDHHIPILIIGQREACEKVATHFFILRIIY